MSSAVWRTQQSLSMHFSRGVSSSSSLPVPHGGSSTTRGCSSDMGSAAAATALAWARGAEIRPQEIRAAIARAAELRALHAALLPGGHAGTSSALRLSPPCQSRASRQFSAEDYPLFSPPYHRLHSGSHSFLEISSRSTGLHERDEENGKQDLFDDKKEINSEHRLISTTDDGRKLQSTTLCKNHVDLHHQPSPWSTSMSGSEESKLVIACNRCRPASISRVADSEKNRNKNMSSTAASSTSTADHHHSSLLQLNQKKIGSVVFSRLSCPRLMRRKPKSKLSPKRLEPAGEKPGVAKVDSEVCSIERVLTKELIGASENRDAAFAEVGEMRSSLQELREKLTHLEAHCKELKTALKQALHGTHASSMEKHDPTERTKSSGTSSSRDCSMPVSVEVMLEGFLQVAAEARLSVAQFCRSSTLIDQTEEADAAVLRSRRGSKGLQHHLESLVNRILYQDFENCVFQRDGARKILNPQEHCLENFSTFVALRSLSWKEALKKGSLGYSEDLSRFCDQKMSSVVSLLDRLGRCWPEQLRQAFSVAAKCVWQLHLLAFSFSPPLVILRVEENRGFDPLYMEDVLPDSRHRTGADQDHVKVMVMPGFYVQDRVVIRCRVVCKQRSAVQL